VVAKGLVDDLIENVKEEKLLGLNLFPKSVTGTKNVIIVRTNCDKTNN
jgi:hypothetical protein